MQLMTFNSLLMFDVVFVFFLFLVGVTCLVYYLPPATKKSKSKKRYTTSDQLDCELGASVVNIREKHRDEEEAEQYYRQFDHRYHHRCPHHSHHHSQQLVLDDQEHQQFYDQEQQEPKYHSNQQQYSFVDHHYMPVMTSSPSSSSSASGRGYSRAYLPIPSTPPPPPPPQRPAGTIIPTVDDDDEEQGNMEILPPVAVAMAADPTRPTKTSSRHLYQNILNSAFEQHGDPYEDEDELDMIATNVEILSSPIVSLGSSAISTSLPVSPDHNNSIRLRPEVTAQDNPNGINSENRGKNNNNTNNQYHLPLHPRLECHSARHVVGICQYHMQQHLKSHQQQHHQMHRLYQQQQLLQQFASQQQRQQQLNVSTPTTPTPSSSAFLKSSSSIQSLAAAAAVHQQPSIIQNPNSVELLSPSAVEQHQLDQRKVQYVVVDTTTDRNKKQLNNNKYCHVKAQNCDINRKCTSGPVDEV